MLPPKNRLKTTYEYGLVRKKGIRYDLDTFSVFALNHLYYRGPCRVGIVLSTKISKRAVKRNAVRRKFSECLRSKSANLGNNYWLVLQPKRICIEMLTGREEPLYEKICADIDKAISKIFIAK